MFSLIPPTYERQLQEELYNCHEYMKLSMTEIMSMPTRLRRFYISVHNRNIDKQNQQLSGKEELTAENFNQDVML